MNIIKNNSFLKNIIKVTASNGVTLIASILTGFLIPIVMGVTEYGYYKIYALYSAYTALCHFGFTDGILLRFAGKQYDSLDFQEMRAYTRFFIVFQVIVGLLFILVLYPLVADEFHFICFMLGINLLLKNLTTHYQFISQATQRFTEMSIRNTLSAIAHVVIVIICCVLYISTQHNITHQFYLSMLTISSLILTIWYVATYRNITFGRAKPIRTVKKDIFFLFKTGIFLTISFQVANLILVMDRQFVSIFYEVDVYSEYAFAYSVIAIFTTLVSATAVVLFPMLRQVKIETAMNYFTTSVSAISMVACLALIGYFPICRVIERFMPSYIASIQYLKIIIPAMIPMGCISIVLFTYYKVLNKNEIYLKCGCIVLAISFVCNMIAQIIFKSPSAVSAASVIVAVIWYLMANRYFVQVYNVLWKKNFVFLILQMISFYIISSSIKQWILGAIIQSAVVLIISRFFYKNMIRDVIQRLK